MASDEELFAHQFAHLVAAGSRHHWEAGATLFHEGEWSDSILFIESGRVKVSSSASSGKQVLLAFRGAGEVLGEFSAIDERERSASVIALTPVTATAVPGAVFRRFLRENTKAAFLLLRIVVGRLREADLQRLEFGVYDVTARIALLLIDLARRYGEPSGESSRVMISLALSQTELANAAGASREGVAKALRRLRDLGAVRTGRRRVEVLDRELLAELAEACPAHAPSVSSDAERRRG